MRFDEFSEDWLRHTRSRGLAPKTLETYQNFVEHHLVPAFGEKRLGALTRKDVEDYLVSKAGKRPLRVRRQPRNPRRRPAAVAAVVRTRAQPARRVAAGPEQELPAARVPTASARAPSTRRSPRFRMISAKKYSRPKHWRVSRFLMTG